MVVASIDWTVVSVAAITAIPATIAAILSADNRRKLRTSNGDWIGQAVENANAHAQRADVIVTRALGQRQGDSLYDGTLEPEREQYDHEGENG
jgi:hypothetical protein